MKSVILVIIMHRCECVCIYIPTHTDMYKVVHLSWCSKKNEASSMWIRLSPFQSLTHSQLWKKILLVLCWAKTLNSVRFINTCELSFAEITQKANAVSRLVKKLWASSTTGGNAKIESLQESATCGSYGKYNSIQFNINMSKQSKATTVRKIMVHNKDPQVV